MLLGASPDAKLVATIHQPLLVLAGTLDGVNRLSSFAVLRHRALSEDHNGPRLFAVVPGASHRSFASDELRAHELDLEPTITASSAAARVAALIAEQLLRTATVESSGTEPSLAARVAQPLVDALELEGSEALGKVWCNSDWPTNPTCNYPKYPDFSLPFGPAPAPAPPLPPDCICVSAWVMNEAAPRIAGVSWQTDLQSLVAADAFHDVSDEHPFHLPHIWSSCASPSPSCTLNVTTLTMPVLGGGSLFPNATSAPLSALEMRAKIKSRQTVWEAAGLKPSSAIDKNATMCREINQAAWDWALAHAEPSVRATFEAHGEPFVMVDDKEAPIGITGPTWIKQELVYKRVGGGGAAGNKTHVEVQSWSFVVGESPVKSKAVPDGMHYCKLLSPARAMEWIYTDGLRMRRSAGR